MMGTHPNLGLHIHRK